VARPAGPRRRARDEAREGEPGGSRDRKRLAPWERRELGEVGERVTELEAALGEIDRELADPRLYEARGARIRELKRRRAATSEELDSAMVRWEELAEREE